MNAIASANQLLAEAGVEAALAQKWKRLVQSITAIESAVVAFSGGVDSSFLAYAAYTALGDHMAAVTIQSEVELEADIEAASELARQTGFRHVIIPQEVLSIPEFRQNPPNRCYICKTHILRQIRAFAAANGYKAILEGQNADDSLDYRPGRQAVVENEALSPLAEQGLTKAEIRSLARALGLSIWDRPSSPCLASRFPYGNLITLEGVKRVALAEAFLQERGFRQVRVRSHGSQPHELLARIEVAASQIEDLLKIRSEIFPYFRELGFVFTTMDLQGYRMGNLNEGLGL